MSGVDVGDTFEVGDGACHLQNTVAGAGRQVELFGGIFQQLQGRAVDMAEASQLVIPQQGVGLAGAFVLHVSRLDHALSDIS